MRRKKVVLFNLVLVIYFNSFRVFDFEGIFVERLKDFYEDVYCYIIVKFGVGKFF